MKYKILNNRIIEPEILNDNSLIAFIDFKLQSNTDGHRTETPALNNLDIKAVHYNYAFNGQSGFNRGLHLDGIDDYSTISIPVETDTFTVLIKAEGNVTFSGRLNGTINAKETPVLIVEGDAIETDLDVDSIVNSLDIKIGVGQTTAYNMAVWDRKLQTEEIEEVMDI